MKKIIALILTAWLLCSAFVACGEKDAKTVTVAATSAPHAEILEQCKDAMAEKGYTLVIRVMDDYIIPNTATEDGEVDANYFQHIPYLEEFNASRGTHLVIVDKIHYEPYAIYAGTAKSLDDLADGAKVAVPNDPTNEARALQLLQAAGLIKLKDGVGLNATKLDIVENPKNLEIAEMEAALLTGVLDDVAIAVINGNYAIAGGLKVADALGVEASDSEAAQTFANVLVAKEGNEQNEGILALSEVLKSDAIKTFIETKYEGAVIPLF